MKKTVEGYVGARDYTELNAALSRGLATDRLSRPITVYPVRQAAIGEHAVTVEFQVPDDRTDQQKIEAALQVCRSENTRCGPNPILNELIEILR